MADDRAGRVIYTYKDGSRVYWALVIERGDAPDNSLGGEYDSRWGYRLLREESGPDATVDLGPGLPWPTYQVVWEGWMDRYGDIPPSAAEVMAAIVSEAAYLAVGFAQYGQAAEPIGED